MVWIEGTNAQIFGWPVKFGSPELKQGVLRALKCFKKWVYEEKLMLKVAIKAAHAFIPQTCGFNSAQTPQTSQKKLWTFRWRHSIFHRHSGFKWVQINLIIGQFVLEISPRILRKYCQIASPKLCSNMLCINHYALCFSRSTTSWHSL